MFERFTQEINNVLDLAYDETQRLGHKETATVQLLLGLIRQEKGLAAQVLTDTGVSLENARLEVEKIQGRGAGSRKDIPYNQHTMEVFDFSVEEADQLKDSEIDTEHLLLGLLRQTQGGAVRVLQILGVEPNELRNQVLRKLAEQGHPTASQFLPSSPPANSNGTDSNKVHLALIQKILENTQGSEAEVVRNNPDLIDPELIERVASILEQQKNSQGAELLRGLITPRHQQKTEATANLTDNSVPVSQSIEISSLPKVSVSVPKPVQLPDPPQNIEPIIQIPAPTNQEMEKFIFQLVRVTFESKGNEEIVHNFFRENLHQLNDRLPDVLRNLWLSKFTNLDQDKKLNLAKRILAISSLIRKCEGGSRANNLEIALTGYHIIASVFTEAEYPEQWAIIQNCLGLTYLERLQGNREENLKQASAYFTAALSFYNKEQFPRERKIILGSLRKATTEIGNLSGTQENQQINQTLPVPPASVESSLTKTEISSDNSSNLNSQEGVINSESVKIQNNSNEEQEENDDEESDDEENDPQLQFLWQALRITAESNGNPQLLYLLLQQNLDLLDDNLPQVLKDWATEAIAKVEPEQVEKLATLIGSFSEVIQQLPLGIPAKQTRILQTALVGFEIVATVFTKEAFPEKAIQIQNNIRQTFLFLVFSHLSEIEANQGDIQSIYPVIEANLDKLDADFPQFLRDWINSVIPAQQNLSFTNQSFLLQAIAVGIFAFSKVMKDFPQGNQETNLEIAIAGYESVTNIFNRDSFPIQWGEIQNQLGQVYLKRQRGDRALNLQQAIKCFLSSLKIFTPDEFPEQREIIEQNLNQAALEAGCFHFQKCDRYIQKKSSIFSVKFPLIFIK